MKNTILLYLTVGCITIFGCNTKHPDTKELDTVTTGTIAIDVDENYQPLLVAEIDVFDSLYPKAKILANYTSESVAVANLINDSVSAVVIGRKLKEKELDYFKKRGFTPKETLIAKDGLALIVHNNNRDTALTVEQVKQILSGKITKWKDINPKSVLGDIQVVFDNPNSCT
ncbi:MAG: substrate-binding domain-containing protein, partial [Saprospiraceae bacterium]